MDDQRLQPEPRGPAAAGGGAGDRVGRRRLFAGGLGLFVATSAACALAPGVGWLIAARAVQGVGAALVIALALSIVSAAFPPRRRGAAIGILEGAAANAVVGAVGVEGVGKAAGANGLLRELGGVFGIAIAVAVFAGAGGYASAETFSDGFAPAIGTAAALSLAGALASLAMPGRRRVTPVAGPAHAAVPALEGERGA